MKKNTASQIIGAQLVSATDGSAVTSGTTSVSVTGDGGTQGAGSGTVTHEGNGFWSYAPTQAETNYDHVAYTFTNSSAVPATVQVYTTFPQTGDSFARLGAPAGASVSADIATVDGNVDAILVDTAEIGAAGAGLTEAGGTGDHLTALATAAALTTVDGNVDLILEDTGTTLPATLAALNDLSAAEVNAEVDTALADYDAPTKAELDAGLAALNDPTAAAIADAVWDEAKAGHVTAGSFGEEMQAHALSTEVTALNDISASDVLTAATSDPISANVKEVNDVTLGGAGTTGDEWGPAA